MIDRDGKNFLHVLTKIHIIYKIIFSEKSQRENSHKTREGHLKIHDNNWRLPIVDHCEDQDASGEILDINLP